MNKVLSLISTFTLVFSAGLTQAASANSSEFALTESAMSAAEFSASAAGEGPDDGDFKAWVKRLYNGKEVKFYVKYPRLGQKVQILVNGKERSYFRLGANNLDTNGKYVGLQNHIYFIRTLELDEGKNRIQVLVDGEVQQKAVYTKSDVPIGPPPPPPSRVELSGPTEAAIGDTSFTAKQVNIPEGLRLEQYCLTLNGAAVSYSNVGQPKFGSIPVSGYQDGCFRPSATGAAEDFSFNVLTKILEDGRHTLNLKATFKAESGDTQVYEDSLVFESDNFSLAAIARPYSITGVFTAGQKVSVNPGYWGSDIEFSYQWFSGEDKLRGATGTTYLLTGADVGKKVKVEVTASRDGEDDYTSSAETLSTISAQTVSARSSTGSYNTSTQFGVVETNYNDEEIANYTVTIAMPSQIVCTTSCSVVATATWGGVLDQYSSIGGTVYLKTAGGTRLDSSYLFLSRLSQQVDTLEFSFSAASLSVGSMNYLTLEIPTSIFGARETVTMMSQGSISAIRGPNNGGFVGARPSFDTAVTQSINEVARGRLSGQDWNYFNYVVPTQVKVMSECMPVQIYAAPLSLLTSKPDGSANYLSDVSATIRGAGGVIRETLTITGSSNGWSGIASNYILETKVCGLSTKLGESETLTLQLSLSYDAYDSNFQTTVYKNIQFSGGLRWTTVNCYKGTAGQVVTGYKAACPAGWTQTTAKISGGKVVMTTINCLKGSDVEVVTAPEPKCPAGYEITNRAVKNGKLVPWTITCVKGVATPIRVTGVFPRCPSGYTQR